MQIAYDRNRYQLSFACGRFLMRDSVTGLETDLVSARGQIEQEEIDGMLVKLRGLAREARENPTGSTTPGIQTPAQSRLRDENLRAIREKEAKIHPVELVNSTGAEPPPPSKDLGPNGL